MYLPVLRIGFSDQGRAPGDHLGAEPMLRPDHRTNLQHAIRTMHCRCAHRRPDFSPYPANPLNSLGRPSLAQTLLTIG